jgi:hypothetical protein
MDCEGAMARRTTAGTSPDDVSERRVTEPDIPRHAEMRIHHVGLLELRARGRKLPAGTTSLAPRSNSSSACKFAHNPQLWNSFWDAAVPSAMIVPQAASIKTTAKARSLIKHDKYGP